MGKPNPEAIRLAKDFKRRAAKKYGIKKITMFGSQATGITRKDSDIDLLVVSDKCPKKAEYMSRLFREWHIVQKKKHPVDFICYTPEEFNKLSKKITIVKQAIEEGVVI